MTYFEHIQQHPKIAFIVGTIHLLLAFSIKDAQIPLIIMQGFQIVAWTITSIVGLIAIAGWIKKHSKKHK